MKWRQAETKEKAVIMLIGGNVSGDAEGTGIYWKGTREESEIQKRIRNLHRSPLSLEYYFILGTGQNFTRTRTEQLLGDCELNNDSGDNMVLGKIGVSTIHSGENLLNILGI